MAVRPQDDLFRYVNGEWLDTAEIPADQSMTGAFIVLRDEAELACRGLLEEAAKESEQRGHERSEARSRDRTEQSGAAQQQGEAGSTTRLIGDLYRSFMDTERVEELGLAPFADQLAAVDGIEDVEQFFGVLGALERQGIGGLFGLYVDTDPAQPDRYVVNLLQGGLGLPDESFYREEQYIPLVDAYREHVSTLLDLGGRGSDGALTVFAVDREVAAQHWDRVRSRDRDQTNNPRTRAELDELLPAAWWSAWLAGIQAPENVLDEVIVRQPSFFAALPDLFTADRLADWKVWLSWRVLHSVAPYGPQALVDENFSFYGRTLSGTPELRERWKRGVGFVEGAAGEALGERYVAKYFPPAAKQRMDELVGYLVAAYRQEIGRLSWMSDVTKARALDKLEAFTPKVGYPPKWRDYSALAADAADLAGNVRRATAFEVDREFGKIGSPVDRDEWFMTPQTVNAYYNPGMNEIVFPAAILQTPFFDKDADDAVNFGGIGAVIGHEIGHGFDDQGSKVDGTGAQVDWWTADDKAAFQALTAKLIAQYDALRPEQLPDGDTVNGALTVGENIGDLGGLGIAYQAWQLALDGEAAPDVDGIPAAQRLFTSWALIWRAKGRDEEVKRRLAIDPHSPPEFRCNQVVRNLTEFYTAFDVGPTDELWLEPEDRVRIW
jgi:putative endopeptidase